MKKIYSKTFLLILIISSVFIKNVSASRITVTGAIATNTVWAVDTIFVSGNLTVNSGVTLTINPGKFVIFQGHYGLFVQGRLLANGIPTNKITFTAANTTTGWSGIRFVSTPSTNDTSFIVSCKILYGFANIGATDDQCGGGIFVKSFSKLVVRNCILSNCYASYYGGAMGLSTDASPTLVNNVFCNNTAISMGGAIWLSTNSNPLIINNTFANNHSNAWTGGIDINSSTPIIKNCIFWGNTATNTPQIYPIGYASVSYSNIEGGWSGTGNINSDPLFISPSTNWGYGTAGFNANWGLKSSSPCKNKGVASTTNYMPVLDVAGNLRIDYDTIEMGALEIIQSNVLCGNIAVNTSLSKYVIVSCDVNVNNGVTLTIPAGAKVRFLGPYKLNVNGRLLAIGTFDNLIRFYPVASGNPWKGIRFDNTAIANDTSKIEYCVLQNSFATGTLNDNYGGAILSNNVSKLIIRNNYLCNNRAALNGGAIACFGSSPFIISNQITNNTVINGTGGGIYLSTSNSNLINNTISRNSSNNINGNGVYVASGTPILRNNIIWRNNYLGGAVVNQIYPATGLNMQYCDIEGGIYAGVGNISTDPLFKSVSAGYGYGYDGFVPEWLLQTTSTLINAGTPGSAALLISTYNLRSLDPKGRTRIYGTIDLGAFEDVSSINVCGQITQNTTWNATTVHITCDVTVKNGVTLIIAPGTKVVFDNFYFLRINGRLLAMGTPTDSIRFYALNSTIGWNGIRFDSMANIYPNNNDTSRLTFCRFENGKGNVSGAWPSYYGGAFFTSSFDKIIISNSLFTNNTNVAGYTSGAAFASYFGSPTIRNCTFTRNSATAGGAIFLYGFNGIIENCKITNNNATNGGGIYIGGYNSGKIINTLIVNNTASFRGGGIYLENDNPQSFTNCTVSNNLAQYGGGMACTSNSDPVIKNCIFWSNSASVSGNEFYLDDIASDPKIYYSDVSVGPTGFSGTGSGSNYANVYQNNIKVDPFFVSPTASDGNGAASTYNGLSSNWRILQGSPCINAGTPGAILSDLPDLDLDLKKRIYNGRIDMGAYENPNSILACDSIRSDKTWEADTIKVSCNVIVANGVTLTISPGTFVQFQGPYKLEVLGRLLAIGTASRKITFTIKDTNYFSRMDSFNRGGWKGIQFNSVAVANDSSKLVYCNISFGKASGASSQNQIGGGLYIYNTNKILISNSFISNNRAAYAGAAIYLESSNPRILNNVISNNSVTKITGGFAYTGVVSLNDANPDFFNNTVVNNVGGYNGGLMLTSVSSPSIKNCIFYNNYSAYYLQSNGTNYYGDMYTYGSSQPNISNCVFTNQNTVMYWAITNYQNVLYSDPLFVSPIAGIGANYDGSLANWSLTANTPCLNAGTPSSAGLRLPSEDFAGKQRVIGDTLDIGAYEIQIHKRFITSQPAAVIACVGTRATFSVSTSISVAYQWQKNGVNILGATNRIYPINSVIPSDSGYYRCLMSNQNGNITSDSAKLTVKTLPSITTHPFPTNSACLGGSDTFSVTASGTAPLSYQWYNLNGAVSGGSNSSYIINPIVSSSASTYRCVVTNSCSSANSNGATLTINTPVSLSAISPTNSICVGGTVSFTTLGTGTAPITYKWYKDGTLISGANSLTYQILNAQTTHAGIYYCKATNICRSDSTNTSTLTVNAAPSITYQSSADSVCVGQSKNFIISASSSLSVGYQWYFNNISNAISGATNNIYTINSVSPTSGGVYYCKATNSCGVATSSAINFTVKTAPTITTQTSNVVVCAAQVATFSVTATGTAPITYRWYKDNVFISGATSSSYQINSVLTTDAGNYYCTITNSCGSINSSVKTLTVNTVPTITYQSPNDSVCLGQSKSFNITTSGSSPIAYQWYFPNIATAISGATNNFYTINSVASSHGGTYYCKATNTCSSATSSVINFTVKTAPVITTQSSNLVLCATQQANFSVTAAGTGPITYKWYKDNVFISGAVSSAYQISSVTTADAGYYYCIISNSCGSINSATISLVVNTVPTITYQSPNDSACLGQSKSFNITATGSSPITYQWYFPNIATAISGATNNFYTINSVASSHSGTYYCKATNTCSSATTSAISFTVKTAPAITTQSSNLVLCATQQANFSVTATGTAPITYKWYKDNAVISGAIGSSYQINSVATSDAGNYYCVISNSCGSINSSTKTLTVNTVAAISSQSASDSICLGQTKSFSVNATGSSPITYQWYFNTTSNAITSATNNFYSINSIKSSDAGSYYCKATNSCGSATTSQITLYVRTAPVISAQTSSATRCVGQGQNFSVTASGSPTPTYQWYKDDVAISGATNNAFAISVVAATDAGNYQCVVSNACGYAQSSIKTLTVNTAPVVTFQTANSTKCTGQSITLDTKATGTSPLSYQWYQWGNPISTAINNFYSINGISTADSGTYYCIVTNTCGTAKSANIRLKVNLPVSVYKQSRDTSKCVGDATLFSTQVIGTAPIKYAWYFEADSIAGAHSPSYYLKSVKQSNSGNYSCKMTNVCGSIDGAYKELIVRALPVVHLGNDTTLCLGGTVELAVDGPYFCKWSNGSNKLWLNVTHSGSFFVNVTDPYGCKNYSDTINVNVLEPFASEIICVVSVDPASGKNLIAWERTRGYRIASYNVYKETSKTGVYQLIGSIPFDSLSVLIDYNSVPRQKADRYAITVIDSCGNESDYSPFHKSIHLTASKGTSGENNLNWNQYEGFAYNTYKIYRGTSPSNMALLNSVASSFNSYSDLAPPTGLVFYQVSAIKLDTCYPANFRAQTNSGPYSQSVSNLKDYSQAATAYISASPVESYIGWREGSAAIINIYTNLNNWDAATTSNWLTLEKDFKNNVLRAVAFQNNIAQPRSDTVHISSQGATSQDVIIHQDGSTSIVENTPDIQLMVYPNPFNYSTNIEYELLKDADVNIEVFNMVGSRVASVINQHQSPGKFNYTFNDAKEGGVYILRIVVNNSSFIKKLIKTE